MAKSALVMVCVAVAVLAVSGMAWAAVCGSGCPTIRPLSPAADSTTSDVTPEIAATVKDRQTNLAKKHIKLFVDGTGTTTFSYNRATDRLSHTPAAALTDGGHTVKIVARDTAGNVGRKIWTFSVGTPPDTAIDSGPQGTVANDSASFSFSSSKAGSTFECSLDGSAFVGCSSPKGYSGLSQGPHTFQVRATDSAGNVDATPASRSWTVDTTLDSVTVTPNPLDFTPGSSTCNTTITKTVTITNNTASEVVLFPSVVNSHYSVASDALQIASGESLDLSVSWTAPDSGFRISDPGGLELKDSGSNTIATGDLAAFINCGIEG